MNKKIKYGFTLAEVLITLAIIGIVAATTIPTLINNYQKRVVVTRLQKFYSAMNQALLLSQAENGAYAQWDVNTGRQNADTMYEWYNKYLSKFFTSKSVEKIENGILVVQNDGSAFGMYDTRAEFNNVHIPFCIHYNTCKDIIKKNNNSITLLDFDGKEIFLFYIPVKTGRVVTYGTHLKYNREQLKTGEGLGSTDFEYACANSRKTFCSALIQLDGWQIKDDYPVKF